MHRERTVIVRLEDVVVEFDGARVLDGVHLEVERGEIVAVAGPSCAGKTTLLRVLAGIVKPTSGTREVTDSIGFVVDEAEEPLPDAPDLLLCMDHVTFTTSDEFERYARASGAAVVFETRGPTAGADRVLYLNDGKLGADGRLFS